MSIYSVKILSVCLSVMLLKALLLMDVVILVFSDIDECSELEACLYGECTNTEGSYDCKCPTDFELLPSGAGCVDKRAGVCYLEFTTTAQTGNHQNGFF